MPKKITKAVTNKKKETNEIKNNTAKEEEAKPVTKKTEAKPVVKKTTATKKKEETKPVAKPAEKEAETKTTAKKVTAAKKVESKPAAKKVTAAKKVESKPAAKKVTAAKKKSETKPVAKPAEKKAETKTTAKKVTAAKKVESKPVAKKATTTKKKEEAKPATKKAETKTTVKKKTTKPVAKKPVSKKIEQYNKLSLDTCFDLLRSMGIELSQDDIVRGLMLNPDVEKFSSELVEKNNLKGKYKFEDDGYDEDLIGVVVQKVYDVADVKPTSVEDLKADVDQAMAYTFVDETKDGEEYNRQFDVMRKVLVLAQNKDVYDSNLLDDEIGVDIEKFVVEFMDLAYKVLKTWKYEDVDYYEQFIFAVFSQFENLHKLYHNRIMMDVADLYILHGDYGLGDADYGYILRENQIKDYIYYRYASVYETIDFDKAKQIASSALQFVDDRYTYYQNIIAILEK